jgi:hypothetical protein
MMSAQLLSAKNVPKLLPPACFFTCCSKFLPLLYQSPAAGNGFVSPVQNFLDFIADCLRHRSLLRNAGGSEIGALSHRRPRIGRCR